MCKYRNIVNIAAQNVFLKTTLNTLAIQDVFLQSKPNLTQNGECFSFFLIIQSNRGIIESRPKQTVLLLLLDSFHSKNNINAQSGINASEHQILKQQYYN